MVYTKEEFKRLWEADIDGTAVDGITNEDCADCAKAWGLYRNPKCVRLDEVVYSVCKEAGVKEDDMPNNPFVEEEPNQHTITEDFAWQVYNLINRWKAGEYGECPLQNVLDKEL